MIEDLHEHTAQRCMRIDFCSKSRRRGERKEGKHAVAKVIYRQVRNHAFQVTLCPRRQRRENNRANDQRKQPRPDDSDFIREQWKQQAHESVNAHF